MFLEVTLANGQNYSVPIQDGHSLQQELDLFLNREGFTRASGCLFRNPVGSYSSATRTSFSSARRLTSLADLGWLEF